LVKRELSFGNVALIFDFVENNFHPNYCTPNKYLLQVGVSANLCASLF
jgi:hypothetical protein